MHKRSNLLCNLLSLGCFLIGLVLGYMIPQPKRHWVETHRSYQPGRENISCEWCSMEQIKPLIYGVTTIEYTDTVTGETKTEERIGDLR